MSMVGARKSTDRCALLQGTFETLSLSEVLGLLATSRKSGILWAEAGTVDARISFVDGRCCAAESGETTGAVATSSELFARVVDVCFALCRQGGGAFHFAADAEPPWTCDDTLAVTDVLGELARLLDEWQEIQQVVPSLEARARLCGELGADEITLDRDRWRLLVALDGRRTVRDVVHETVRSVLDICHELVDLVAAGAIEILEAPPDPGDADYAENAVSDGDGAHHPDEDDSEGDSERLPVPAAPPVVAAPGGAVTPEAPYGPGVDDPAYAPGLRASTGGDDSAPAVEPGPEVVSERGLPDGVPDGEVLDEELAAALESVDPRDRGAFLRLFSALRDA
jgi:hypothetical protein